MPCTLRRRAVHVHFFRIKTDWSRNAVRTERVRRLLLSSDIDLLCASDVSDDVADEGVRIHMRKRVHNSIDTHTPSNRQIASDSNIPYTYML